MSIEEIGQYIIRLKEEYEREYHEPPNFVKIPRHIFVAFQAVNNMVAAFSGDRSEPVITIADLRCCPTISIEHIEDIEVF